MSVVEFQVTKPMGPKSGYPKALLYSCLKGEGGRGKARISKGDVAEGSI